VEDLRAQIEIDLHESLEGEWKMAVELTSPSGETQKYSKNNPDELLGGQILYFTRRENPNTGEIEVVNQPVVTLRISSLNIVPQNGEKWYIKMPISPVANTEKESFVFTPTRSIESGTDIGFIRIYPQKIINTGSPIS
jgi:hypothetical protein